MKSLKNKSKIEELFTSTAKKVNTPSVRARFVDGNGEVLISVPSKIFKRAVDRNRLKRLIRESLKEKDPKGKDLALIYNKSIVIDLVTIKKDIDRIFEVL